MAEDQDTVVVELEPDLFEQAGGKKDAKTETVVAKTETTKVETREPSEDLAEQFEALKTQSAQRDRDRSAELSRIQRERDDALRIADKAQGDALESQISTVESGIAAAQAEAESAEREYKTAFEAGDSTATAAAQRKIARAEAKIARLDEAKDDLATRKTRQPAAEERVERQTERRAPADPVEAYVQGRSEPTAQWLRAHPEWVTDTKKNIKLTAAHYDAVSNDLAVDTPEYFEHVEKYIGLKTNGAAKPNGNGADKPTRRVGAPPAAPVHQSGGGTNGGSREVILTKGEAAAATDGTHVYNYDDTSPQKKFKKGDPIGIQEFARRKLELQKQGAYDRTYTEQ